MDTQEVADEMKMVRQAGFAIAKQFEDAGMDHLMIAFGLASVAAQILGGALMKDKIDESIDDLTVPMKTDAHMAHDFMRRKPKAN